MASVTVYASKCSQVRSCQLFLPWQPYASNTKTPRILIFVKYCDWKTSFRGSNQGFAYIQVAVPATKFRPAGKIKIWSIGRPITSRPYRALLVQCQKSPVPSVKRLAFVTIQYESQFIARWSSCNFRAFAYVQIWVVVPIFLARILVVIGSFRLVLRWLSLLLRRLVLLLRRLLQGYFHRRIPLETCYRASTPAEEVALLGADIGEHGIASGGIDVTARSRKQFDLRVG